MEEIDIKEIFYYIYKRKNIVILSLILGFVFGLIYTKFFITPMYSSYATVVLVKSSDNNNNNNNNNNDSNNIDTNTITQSDVTLNQKLVATYSEIMKSRVVAEEVKQKLNLNINEAELMSNISVSTKDDTEMLKIQVSNKDPKTAANIANALSDVFKQKVKEIYNIENVKVIDKAISNDTPYNVNYIKNSFIFAITGLFLSCLILFIFFYFDTKIKTKEEVENLLNLEVLSVIPEIKS